MGNIHKTIAYLKRNGLKKTVRMAIQRINEERREGSYELDRAFETATPGELMSQKHHVFKKPVMLSLLVPAYETPDKYLRELLDSLFSQSYENFELIIADASESSIVKDAVSGYSDRRLVYIKLEANEGISGNTNRALENARGDAVVFIDHDDFLEPDALYHLALAFDEGADLVYTDEDKFCDGRYMKAHRKPDFNYDLLLSNNYISHLFAARTELVKRLGGLRREYDGAQDFDLILRCAHEIMKETGFFEGLFTDVYKRIVHVPKVLYHWRIHSASTAENPTAKSYAYEAGRRVLTEHMKERGIKCRVRHTEHLGFYKIDYAPAAAGLSDSLKFNLPKKAAHASAEDLFKKTCGIFQRSEVKTIVYKAVGKGGRVLDGPYAGMKWWDSGVMHMAAISQDIEDGDYMYSCQAADRSFGLTVYLP